MNRGYLLIGLVAVTAIVAGLMFSYDPELANRYAQMRREVTFSPATQDLLLGIAALAIGGYLAWSYLKRD